MTVTQLNPCERRVARRAACGRATVFMPPLHGKPKISAGLIRALLFGFEIPGIPASRVPMPGVRITGAEIVGNLELADCARAGTELPVLALEDCDIPGSIELGAARLARLSLARSRFGLVNLREAFIDGPFDFSHAGSMGNADCWIDARGALFNGDVTGTGTTLRVHPREWRLIVNGNRQHALWLAGCTIRGSLWLTEFAASGGVSLDACNISGDVRVADAQLIAEEGDAFRAQNAVIDGIIMMRKLVTNGIIWLLGVRTGGALQIQDSQLRGEIRSEELRHEHTPHEDRSALVLGDADIGASVRLTPKLVVHGRVSFAAAKIRGYLNASGACFHNATADGRTRAIDVTNAEIGANLIMDGAVVSGRFDMAGARVGGKLSFQGVQFSNRTSDRRGQALEAVNATIGGSADFGPSGEGPGRQQTQIDGEVDLTSARIGGDLRFAGATISNFRRDGGEVKRVGSNLVRDGGGIAIKARQAHVQANIVLNEGFHARGALLLTGATVGRDLRCADATLFNPARSALYAKGIEVGDDITLERCVIVGDLRFERAASAGDMLWQGLIVRLPDARVRSVARRKLLPLVLTLMHARIGSRLICGGIEFVGPPDRPAHIDLRSVHAATVVLQSVLGWGKSAANGAHHPVSLHGLTYERIEFDPNLATGPAYRQARDWLRRRAEIPVDWRWVTGPPGDKDRADPLLDWILRGCQDGEWRFNPQLFRQLTRVLRSEGHEGAARNIAMYEQWATPRSNGLSRALFWLYGTCFGFGLWPQRAAIVLSAYVAIGWGAAIMAFEKGWLVETPTVVASSYSVSGYQKPGQTNSSQAEPNQVPPGSTADRKMYMWRAVSHVDNGRAGDRLPLYR